MSRHRKSSMNNSIKDKLEDIKDWISENNKIVMPVILLVCVLFTVAIAINANRKAAAEEEAQLTESTEVANTVGIAEESEETIPELLLEENAYPAVNELISRYYGALAEGDTDTISSINSFVDDTEKIRIQEMSKYIDSYPELDVYTKLGPVEGSYLAYVYSKVKFTEYDQLVPGMQAFYICTDENGNSYVNAGEDNSVITNYIRDISLQDDVVDLNNKVAVEYNELLESDEELNAFLADLAKRIDVSVGEALARAEAAAAESEAAEESEAAGEGGESEAAEETEQVQAEETESNVVKKVRAKEVVNVRSSDSETADKLGKAESGEEFTLLEERGNGWSKITFEGKDAFIKSEYLETVSEEVVEDTTDSEAETSNEETPSQTTPAGDGKTVTVIENVNVRKSASETGEKLGLVYVGEKLELIMKQADGWTKVKYKDQTAYVKSDYVE
ncbi:SH3 domain-containing protein [Kineothrix sp. MB12-C1]|uniref:SH3 domain-containing protein n=1 Tax=Kineothrix sp. MB12-C1 TaxID=3070215 RepID=UPI0027D244EB|nr:SH3 domain-containing protein [Kineothrix sp. MB12-C1]WMC92290.1 SH3 domain-containing protein [Kineothrix sp. MB12-C1]